jgi:hypothetical protein
VFNIPKHLVAFFENYMLTCVFTAKGERDYYYDLTLEDLNSSSFKPIKRKICNRTHIKNIAIVPTNLTKIAEFRVVIQFFSSPEKDNLSLYTFNINNFTYKLETKPIRTFNISSLIIINDNDCSYLIWDCPNSILYVTNFNQFKAAPSKQSIRELTCQPVPIQFFFALANQKLFVLYHDFQGVIYQTFKYSSTPINCGNFNFLKPPNTINQTHLSPPLIISYSQKDSTLASCTMGEMEIRFFRFTGNQEDNITAEKYVCLNSKMVNTPIIAMHFFANMFTYVDINYKATSESTFNINSLKPNSRRASSPPPGSPPLKKRCI